MPWRRSGVKRRELVQPQFGRASSRRASTEQTWDHCLLGVHHRQVIAAHIVGARTALM